ncbi:chromosome segregation protein SMC [Lactobacillus sp. Sy-1]|uniref:chromosome segregation protein SMC n=1 Tax=Lactobacillus sp. Sy-1 TaxID=2109645 RepID=UPI001C560955|nr:chromosome segregation protein SMC [Lactobacillus sp. Sy-1]MBW1605618.1 chromosome segregation protein SMC [Lactobacillus sp. Sy-1]
MKLKSMQLVGFKSFAEKTTIDFQNGLTAIVGPNGSGKSNVIEAIRWVLGEQSAKHLRSTKMADVIFSGSKNRRALNRAEVILTFDNSDHYLKPDYTEITVTRKLFRNGDSYYYLNQRECRLKDINDLLMDSGIGQGSFSIISQGNVEAIFNSKPQDRRNIVETTAGIYKYRQRKQVADHRLSETNDNLTRVNDIIAELKTQVVTLRAQSQAAERFQELNTQLKDWHQAKLTVDAKRLLASYTDAEKQLATQQAQETDLTAQIEQMRTQKQDLQRQIDQLNHQQDQAQAKLLKRTNQIEQYRSQLKLDDQQSSFKAEQLSRAKADLATLVNKYSVIEDQIGTVEHSVAEQQHIIDQLNATVDSNPLPAIESKVTNHNQTLTELRNQYLDLLQRSSSLKNQINFASKDNAQFSQQERIIHDRLAAHKQAVAELETKQAALTTKLTAAQAHLKADHERVTQAAAQRKQLRLELEKEQGQWYTELKTKQQLTARLNGLVEFQNQHGGYFQGSRNLLNHRDQLTGIIGAVGEFIEVNRDYIKSIETALGNRIQQIMVTDNAAARAAVQLMTQRKLGRVTLLPLNSLTKHHLSQTVVNSIQSHPGYVAVASQLVTVADQYQVVIEHLLGNVVIAKDLRSATQIGTILNHRYRIVTLDGQVVNAGGSITGGATQKQFDGMLVQREKQAELKQSVDQAAQRVADLETQVKNKQAQLRTLEQQNAEHDQSQLALKQSVQMLTSQLEQVQSEIEQKQREAATQRINLQNLSANFAQSSATDLEAELDQINGQIEHNQAQVKQTNQQLAELDAKRQRATADHQASREKLILAQAELDHLNQRIADLNQTLAENQAAQIEINQTISGLNQQSTGKLTNADLNHKVNLLQQAVVDLKAQITTRKTTLQNLHQTVTPLDTKIDQAQDTLLNHRTTIERIEQGLQSITQQLQSIKLDASQKYGLSFQAVVDNDVDADLATIEGHLTDLKKQVQGLGPVSIDSITQFAEVNDRYQFLKQQADDLIQSKQQLEATMNKMDATVKDRFKKTFDQLQRAFKATFKEIFGGGDAKLKLTDPHHLLTTGIEIMAQPPGKRFRSMTLLSGGERSLTAIALLFAVLKLQPVPFVILDEAESALDPANVDRFARYIQKLKAQTQFIVITHRKETMVYADNLYGVTMQDSGISKVLAVDLKKAQTTKG